MPAQRRQDVVALLTCRPSTGGNRPSPTLSHHDIRAMFFGGARAGSRLFSLHF
jgi:hypothetical protein